MANNLPQSILGILDLYGVDASDIQLFFGLPEPIFHFQIPGSDAERCWQALHEQVEESGYWPVILGDTQAFDRIIDHLSSRYMRTMSVATALADAAAINPEEWLRTELKKQDSEEGPWDTTEGENALRAPWPDDIQPLTTILTPYNYRTHAPHPQVVIGLIPTRISWHSPVYLRFGNYNACPSPAEHASVLKRWEEQYGAVVVCMTYDIIELWVAHPPKNREQAIALAYEHFAYCSDIVDQGVGSLDALAATLLNGTVWFFWWD